MNKKKWLFAGALVLLPVIGSTLFWWSQGASLRAWRALGSHDLNILLHADKIETYRINPSSGTGKTIGGRTIIGKSQKQDAAFNTRVAKAVLNVFNTKPLLVVGGPDCDFMPGVAFQFTRGNETVDAFVCYDCSAIAVSSSTGSKFSDGFRGELKEMGDLAKAAFPHDAEIQKLQDTK